MKHLAEQVRTRLISQLINGVSNVLNKLLKYINGTLILTLFCTIISYSACYLGLKFKQSTIIIIRGEISNIIVIIYKWFISIELPQTSRCCGLIIIIFY